MKSFLTASSRHMDCLDTNLGNWASTQAFSIFLEWRPQVSIASSSSLVAKEVTGGAGYQAFARTLTGSSYPAFEMQGPGGAARLACDAEASPMSIGTWYGICITYDGSKLVSGVRIYVNNNTPQVLTTISDTLSTADITNSVPVQLGARNGTASPALFANGDMQRACMFTKVLSTAEVSSLMGGGAPDSITGGALLWQELSDVGFAIQPDYSGNSHVFAISWQQVYAAGNLADKTPTVGASGINSLRGPWVRSTPPLMQNLGWVGGANNGRADQIGPGALVKLSPTSYKGLFENDTGVKAVDVGNQPGAFDFDTGTILGTSADGTTWAFTNQDVGTTALINVTNVLGDLTAGQATTFKAAAHGEISVSDLFFDISDGLWKAICHCGNNTGPRAVYLLHCNQGARDPWTAGCWAVQNSGLPVLSASGAGNESSGGVADATIVIVSSVLWYMAYRQTTSGNVGRIGLAKSINKGLTWTKLGTCIDIGAAGTWDGGAIQPGTLKYDDATANYIYVYGGMRNAPPTTQAPEGMGLAYVALASIETIPWTKNVYNPVLCTNIGVSGTNNFEDFFGTTSGLYLDLASGKYRIITKADNGVGGTTAFRGRVEETLTQVVTPTTSISLDVTSKVVNSTGVVVYVTGIGTQWSAIGNTPVFTLSGGTGASITAQQVITQSIARLTINVGSAAGTLTITDPSTTKTATITVTAAPTLASALGNVTVTLTGTNTGWTAGTPGTPTFTLSGGTGASIVSQVVNSATSATLTINPGSVFGVPLTITDPLNSLTTVITIGSAAGGVVTLASGGIGALGGLGLTKGVLMGVDSLGQPVPVTVDAQGRLSLTNTPVASVDRNRPAFKANQVLLYGVDSSGVIHPVRVDDNGSIVYA